MRKAFTAQVFRRRPWRVWVVAYVLLALVWPAIGPLPWLIDFTPDDHHHHPDGSVSQRASDEHARSRSHLDASEIPGSPTHPDDHNCFQCQVIQHLARCVPSAWSFPTVALFTGHSPNPLLHIETLRATVVVPRPPIRGPPLLDV
jgi:hypothetical protein